MPAIAKQLQVTYDSGMEQVHPFWKPKQQQAYAEVALLVCAKGEKEFLTPRQIVQQLGTEAMEYVQTLPCAPDETFRDTFMENLFKDDVIKLDVRTQRYKLGPMGDFLVIKFLDEWAGTPGY